MTLRPRYASLSNSGLRRLFPSRVLRLGITGVKPCFRHNRRIALASYPLSANKIERRSVQPKRSRRCQAPVNTVSNAVQSLTFPGVTEKYSGWPRLSQIRWTLVVSPPRERPSAASSAFFWARRRRGDARGHRSRPR